MTMLERVGARTPYIRWPDDKIIGWCVCVKAPDPPQHPSISRMGWPDPVGLWLWVEQE